MYALEDIAATLKRKEKLKAYSNQKDSIDLKQEQGLLIARVTPKDNVQPLYKAVPDEFFQ